MPDFSAHDGQFWLDGRPQLIQAGEFHYFRCARENWRHRLGLLRDAGFNAVATYIPWRWHQLTEGAPEDGGADLDGHTDPKRDLAGFLDLVADMGFLTIARPGPYIMAETINEGIPSWVLEKYPHVAFISQHGQAQNVVSYLHPDFLHCVSGWFRAVFEVLAPRQITRGSATSSGGRATGGGIIMIQLDNEMDMIPWLRNIMDTNPDTLRRFAAWLSQTYGDGLAERYPTAELAGFLREGLSQPHSPHSAAVCEDYRRFYRGYLAEYATWLWDEARANGMEVPPVINIHGFGNGGKTFPIGLSQLVEVMRVRDPEGRGVISATDVYPLYIHEGNFHHMLLVNEMTRALQHPEQPLFSIEFQAGGCNDFSGNQTSLFDLHARLCVSQGMRAINHYLFANGENDPVLSPVKRHDWGHPVRKDGSLRRQYHRYAPFSKSLVDGGEALILARPHVVTTVGFQLDAYMTEVNNAATEEATKVMTNQRDAILFDFIARGLALTHRPFDAVDLQGGDLDPARFPLIWAMMERQCDAALQQKLVDYVARGGQLVLVGRMCVEEFNHAGCTILKDALGIQFMLADPPFSQTLIDALGYQEIPAYFVETYGGEFDEVIARRGGGAAAEEEVVGFVKTLGQGRVLMLGAQMGTWTLEDLDVVNRIALKMGCEPLFKLSDWADVRVSRGDQGAFLFINNYLDDPVETTVEYAGRMLFDGKPVTLPARSGAILSL